MTDASSKLESLDHETAIRELAYQLWEAEGRPDGQADRHWFMAIEIFETGVVGMLPAAPVDNPHLLKNKVKRGGPETFMPKPVIPLSGRPVEEPRHPKDSKAA